MEPGAAPAGVIGAAHAGAPVDTTPLSEIYPIPRAVRAYGWAVDPLTLHPGDLILVSSKKPGLIARQIRAHQAKLFNDEHARWEHAAVSGGRIEICEAELGGVRATEYWGYMTGEYDIKVRRLKNADIAERTLLAYYSATSVKTRYGYANILAIAKIFNGAEAWGARSYSRGVICSQLYFEACQRAGFLISKHRAETVSPAHLSFSPQLEDVPLAWVKV